MSFETLFNVITSRFSADVIIPAGALVVYPNEEVKDPTVDQLWVRLNIIVGSSIRQTFGAMTNIDRTEGIFVAQVFSPIEQGLGDALSFIDTIGSVFRGKTYSSVRFRTPNINNLGIVGDSKHWQINVECPFVVDNFH